MKKEYQKAEIEILYFSTEDVITTSGGGDPLSAGDCGVEEIHP